VRLLVTGAGGMLGREVAAEAERAGHDTIAADRKALDITDRDAVLAALRGARPDVVINAAAFTAVDACETEHRTAFLVNGTAVGHLVAAIDEIGARLVHVSTDYVFDGSKPEPYVEDDPPNPASAYGASKLAGEQAAAELGDHAVVARTAWVFGQHGANMVKTVLRVKDNVPVLRFVDDQRGSPTSAADLATMLVRLAEGGRGGLFHVTNQGAVSWYEFVREILRQTGDDPARVEAITTAQLDPPRPAPRPANSVLDNAALRAAGEPLLPPYEDALARVLHQLAAV
jgi:dTDP-4-dehydrorhamnose reductase